ncbi:FeoB-associated Cys-rich membrane protein [Lachnospiraceae bacterium 62-35]
MNIPTLVILLGLMGVVTLIIIGMVKDRKNGKICSGNCGSCAKSCHSHRNMEG